MGSRLVLYHWNSRESSQNLTCGRVLGRRCLGLRTCEGACAFDMLGVSSSANLGLCNLEWCDLIFYLS
jgi:hypothetical protein